MKVVCYYYFLNDMNSTGWVSQGLSPPPPVLRGHSVFFIPTITANDLRLRRIFYPRLNPLHLFSYLNSLERASISLLNVQC